MEDSKKIQAMEKHKRAQFVYNIILYTLTSIITFLFFSYTFWFSSIYRLISSIPFDISLFNNAKVIFVVANLIILFIVRESRLSKATPALDFYEEYVSKSRSTNPSKVIMMSSLCNKREEEEIIKQAPPRIERKKKHEYINKNLKMEKIKKEDVIMRKSKSKNNVFQLEEKVEENMNHQEEYLKMEKKKEDVIMRKSKSKSNILQLVEKEKENMNHQEKKLGLRASKSEVWSINDDTHVEMTNNKGSKEELNITTEDLNKRVEAFIARVNRQRLLES